MRQGKVYYKEILAGTITETDEGDYVFAYGAVYVEKHPEAFITFSMPVRTAPYINNRLFAFFEGLIPEGWLLNVATKNWKIKQNDRMGLLLACCQNCIGAVSVEPIKEPHEN
ncbi:MULTISPECIES: HipA N-terminal domain-containing protein [Polaribacter]|jgi:serine/threonine-protein kinase HipA|uniref:HipA N-terminal domain protein n=1 Tax=Polaribacter dokdonensis DSW-5 TaxID=1300348 RepID=A0A0M9CJ76_9FLAO|nr:MULTISPECIES: HipA N-terminal domain-containing protein [Polaribacter]KOY53085.1 HipA N-terminal domain protein [Polaribacter dokdonensis DSW-5]UAM98917.1 HipA N-terminal domain-containing protein [Polaribacter litorisediminis]SEE56956.1 serine/threonine-protein kinase HipA [Polaribacter dokdonensis DSW-5]|tara:strand:+ start:8383 stop:8718 length:336 start_codon:yes stop_codon:yes gene_type:complete